MDARDGCTPGRARAVRWVERVTTSWLAAALASGSLAGYAPSLAHAQASAPSRSAAPAGTTDDRTAIQRADAAFKQGRAFFDLGRYAEACEKFELSMQLDPSPGTSLNLGNCYEPQGDLVRALENFERAFADAQRTRDLRRKELWTEAARERIASLSPRVPKLSVRNVPPGALVALDGHPIEGPRSALRVNPGRHLIEVSAPGKRTFEQDVDIATGQRLAIDVPALDVDESPTGRTALDPSRRGGRRGDEYGPWPSVLGGVGVVFFATSVATGLAAKADENELEDACVGTACPLELEATRDSAKTLALVTDLFWITGLLSAGVGVTLFVLDSRDDATSKATSVEARCFGAGCGLVASGHF